MTARFGSTTASSGLRLRDSPRDGSSLDVLGRGSEVEVLGEETWLRVRAGDQVGFVLADYVQPLEATAISTPAGVAGEVIDYRSANFVGQSIRIEQGFEPALQRLDELCTDHQLRLHITSSLREPYQTIRNAVVEPAGMSNHYIGHAIDMNIISADGFFNSGKLDHFASLPASIQEFLQALPAAGLRWGGTFRVPDSVHIDDGLNLQAQDQYIALLNRIWQGNARLA